MREPHRPSPQRMFVICARVDLRFLRALQNHLQGLVQSSRLQVFSPALILIPTRRQRTVTQQLARAQLIVPLLSANLLAEVENRKYIDDALRLVRRGSARLLPIQVRPVELAGSALDGVAALPRNHVAVSLHKHPDLAWVEIARSVAALLAGCDQMMGEAPQRRRTEKVRLRF
jgi:hypothetical protein